MMAATTTILRTLPEGGIDTNLDEIARAADTDCNSAVATGRASFSYHRLPDDTARAANAYCINVLTCGRASYSYLRLPEPLLRLTVRRINGSFFDVQIARSAAVWELKAAIEGLFDDAFHVPQHVWSHFCLCFKGEKLTHDKATLRALGIKDGDELHFVQHLSIDYTPCKSFKSQRAPSHRRPRTSVDDFNRSRTLLDDVKEENGGVKKIASTRHFISVLKEGLYLYQHHASFVEEDRKKGNFLNNLFSYSRLRSTRKTHSVEVTQSPREKKNTRTKLGKWLSLREEEHSDEAGEMVVFKKKAG